MEIKISDKYEPLFNVPEGVDTFVITGGRFSQKSFAVGLASVVQSIKNEHRVLYSRYTNVAAKDSIIPELEEKIAMLNWEQYFDIKETRILSKVNKAKIVFKGLKTSSSNQSANLKSIKDFSYWVLDEAEELQDRDVAEKTIFSIRGNPKGSEHPNIKVFIMNPTTKTHWVYEKYFQEMGISEGFNGVKGNVCYIHTSYLDCLDFVPDEIVQEFEQMKEKRPEKYKNVVLGGWLEAAEGVIFDNWRFGKFDESLSLRGYGLDFGFSIDPTALVEVAVDKKNKNMYVRLLEYKTRMSTDDIFNMLRVVNGMVVADSAEPRLIHDLNQRLKGRGLQILKSKKGQGSVNQGIQLMRDYEIIVDPNSEDYAKELNNYVWLLKPSVNNRNNQPVPIDAYNHAIDATRYILQKLVGKKQAFVV